MNHVAGVTRETATTHPARAPERLGGAAQGPAGVDAQRVAAPATIGASATTVNRRRVTARQDRRTHESVRDATEREPAMLDQNTPPHHNGAPRARDRPNDLATAFVTSAGIGALSGSIAGLVWGGIGGRIAMRIVFLTSDDRVRGVTSDDGFEIGVISPATVFLMIFTMILGTIAGVLYGLVRMVTAGPTWAVAIATAIATAAAGGAAIVHPDGVDFRLLEPLWLTVGLFVLISGAWGASVVLLCEWLLRPGRILATTPTLLDRRFVGAVGWVLLATITLLGVRALVDDVRALV